VGLSYALGIKARKAVADIRQQMIEDRNGNQYESLGMGSITGFVTTILTLLGWNKRLNKLEDDKQDKNVCYLL
jgi:hypothetical protein